MNLSIQPDFSRTLRAPADLSARTPARALSNAVLTTLDAAPRLARLRDLDESSPIPPTGGSPAPGTNSNPTGGKAAAKDSGGFFSKIGGFFKKVGGFFKTIGVRMGRGIKDGLKAFVWDPLKKHVLAPLGHNIVKGLKEIGSQLRKLLPW